MVMEIPMADILPAILVVATAGVNRAVSHIEALLLSLDVSQLTVTSATNVSPELIGDSSGDNKQTGLDPDGVAYVKTWGDRIRDKIPVEERIPAFFSDFGDEGDAANFIHDQLDGKGFVFDQVFDPLKDKDLLNAQPLYVNNYWLAIYRGSRGKLSNVMVLSEVSLSYIACAQENLGSEVFVSMGKTEDGTKINIFDDIALKSGDNIRPGKSPNPPRIMSPY